MKLYIDDRLLCHIPSPIADHPLIISQENQIQLEWPSLLRFLGLGSIYASLPHFDLSNPLFEATVSTLCSSGEREVVHHVYDQLFTECLRHIQSLPQLNAPYLIQAIEKKCQELGQVFLSPLSAYRATFEENPLHAMHDLILYLSWDLMCLWMGRLFDHQLAHGNFIQALGVIKECLIESFLHITQNGRTSPGIFRMIEALFFFEMREENLQQHSAADWELLSKSFQALASQDELIAVPYIDNAMIPSFEYAAVITVDSPELVHSRQRLSSWMIDRFKTEVPEWKYAFKFPQMIYLSTDVKEDR